MPVYQLNSDEIAFPHPRLASENGLLAVGGELTPDWLVLAYQNGIFPWFEEEGEFYWYSPDPRFVLFPDDLKVHKSMRSIFNNNRFRYTLDTAFEEVIGRCAQSPRQGQFGTWISSAFLKGYSQLHELGIAHSVEVWEEEELIGGLYGIGLGKIFFGESMFAEVSNASKAGFITLVRALKQSGYKLIDCQAPTPHLASLGATNIPREDFLERLHQNALEKTAVGKWYFDDEGGVALKVQNEA